MKNCRKIKITLRSHNEHFIYKGANRVRGMMRGGRGGEGREEGGGKRGAGRGRVEKNEKKKQESEKCPRAKRDVGDN